MLSANTVAQKPSGSVMPPLSFAQGSAGVWTVLCSSLAADDEPVASSMPTSSAEYATPFLNSVMA